MDDSLSFKEYTLFYLVGIFGFICSIISLTFIYKKQDLHNAFGYICAAHSIVEGGVLGCFLLSGAYSIISLEGNGKLAHICMFFYFVGLYLHLLKSINRFCALIFGIKYRIWFSNGVVKILISMAFGMGFFNASPHFWYECSAYFSAKTYFFTTRTTECNSTVIFYDDFITCCATMLISLCCDITTFTYYRIRIKKSNVNFRNNYKLALHAYLTTLLYLTMISSFYVFSGFATNRWTSFLATTFAWISCHALNQMSYIIFVKFLQRKRKTSIVAIALAS